MTRLFLSLFMLVIMTACATPPQSALLLQQTPAAFRSAVIVPDVPFYPQQDYQCGPAALATMLGASQLDVHPDSLIPLVYVPERRGSFQIEMIAAARSFGRLAYQLSPSLEAMFSEINQGRAVLVMQNLGLDWYPQWHFAVVKGYDLDRRRIVLNSGLIEDYELSLGTFERTWARAGHWAVLVLEPGDVPDTASPERYFSAAAALETSNPAAITARAYQAGIERWPNYPALRMAYGNLLYSEQDLDGAALQYQLIISNHPDYAPAYNNLAQIMLHKGDPDQALMLADKAVALGGEFSANYVQTREQIMSAMDSGE